MDGESSCPICKSSFFVEPPTAATATDPTTTTGGSNGSLDRPDNLIGARCCVGACGHLIHTECLLRSLAENPDAGCPVCDGPVLPAECTPVRLPVTVTATIGSTIQQALNRTLSQGNGSGDAPTPTSTSSGTPPPTTSASRSRTASTAFGTTGSNSDPKQARITNSTSGTGGASGQGQAPSSTPSLQQAGSLGAAASGSGPNPPPTPWSQILVVAFLQQGLNLSGVFTPEVSRRFDAQCDRVMLKFLASRGRVESIQGSAMGLYARIERFVTQFDVAPVQRQQQIMERFTGAVVNKFIEVDPNQFDIDGELEIVESLLEGLVQWWDAQTF